MGTELVPDDHSTTVDVVVADGELMVLGDRAVVDEYVDRLRSLAKTAGADVGLTRQAITDVGAGAAAMAAAGASAGEYVRLSPKSLKLLQEHNRVPGTPGFFKGVVRNNAGQFAGQLEFEQVAFGAQQALSLEVALATVALRAAINDVQQAVARVEDKVTDLAALAKAGLIGEVLGQHRLLEHLCDQLEQTGALPSADWDSIASVGNNLTIGVEKLRAFARERVNNLDVNRPAQERSRQLHQMADDDRLGEVLQLLLVVEDSLYRWQTLRIERVRTTQPEHLQDVVDSARKQLRRDVELDGALPDDLGKALVAFGELRPLEVHRFRSREKLERDLLRLREDLDAFTSARRTQIMTWRDIRQPTIADARKELRRRAIETGRAISDAAENVYDLSLHRKKQAGEAARRRARRRG